MKKEKRLRKRKTKERMEIKKKNLFPKAEGRRPQTGHEVADELFLARKSSSKKKHNHKNIMQTPQDPRGLFFHRKKTPAKRKI